ncbi:hypothetical protein TRFO_05726 [Tritrichomonas foetus]|uniref:Rab-GAP TBC domain-containing protein n=1 Tax=Tritrichomonas foetus TaxID=1144522 RepID=A0A1J4K4E8_9EUKA|nr:hypothetical protein TRFO_05726 [Tritrichomonas foetus]|eukprot:OHT06067.1 hypothetical protein TRFO_05726 [Tritrichomonas foetus]
MEKEYLPLLLPERKCGFISIEVVSDALLIKFYPMSKVPRSQLSIFSHFLFTHRLPECLISHLNNDNKALNDVTVIDTSIFTRCLIDSSQCQISFLSDEKPTVGLKFVSPFYFLTFLNQISITHILNSESNDCFSISPIKVQKTVYTVSKNPLANTDDLNAHKSLLEYLNLTFDATQTILTPFDSSILLKLLETPDDMDALTKLSKSLVPSYFAPLLIVILLLDSPLFEGENNSLLNVQINNENHALRISSAKVPMKRLSGVVPDPAPLQSAPKKLYGVDEVSLGGSSEICTDYNALKSQWTTITSSQFQHMPNFRISLKLLENVLLATFPSGHPLIKVIFNAMASHFMMRDKFETYVSEFYHTMTAVAQIFHPIEKIIEIDATEMEHFIFWLFTALISRTGTVELIEQRNPAELLQNSFRIVMVFHPLMYDVIDKAGLSSFKFPMTVVYSLYSKVTQGPKLWSIWVAALASGDPMNFFQTMMAMALIVLFPEVAGSNNVIEAVEKHLKLLFEKCPSEVLISNTIKMIDAYSLNQ